jgi:hypothetical protein
VFVGGGDGCGQRGGELRAAVAAPPARGRFAERLGVQAPAALTLNLRDGLALLVGDAVVRVLRRLGAVDDSGNGHDRPTNRSRSSGWYLTVLCPSLWFVSRPSRTQRRIVDFETPR